MCQQHTSSTLMSIDLRNPRPRSERSLFTIHTVIHAFVGDRRCFSIAHSLPGDHEASFRIAPSQIDRDVAKFLAIHFCLLPDMYRYRSRSKRDSLVLTIRAVSWKRS